MALSGEIKKKFPNVITEAYEDRGDSFVIARREGIRDLLGGLKAAPEYGFDLLADLFGADFLFWPEKPVRFEVVYNLYSTQNRLRLFVKVQVPENEPSLPSVTSVWPAANWYEREVFDMFGIRFEGHPNLKRILMYEEFKGHPLRKDYAYNQRQPLIGPEN